MDFESLSLAELFAEADRIGSKYQSPEEISDHQAAIEAEVAQVEAILAADPEAAAIAEELFGS